MVSNTQFGAFAGVFVPTFLSVIGVILFLRLGYVVGSAGILGTIIIILLAVSVTISTGLSLSSITTNIRIGGGGAYSIIRKTLGLEIGGAVGIPLYLAQIFSVALYLFGFMEAWQFIFPNHPEIYILTGAFILLLALISISTEIAVKAQVVVFGLVLAALGSVLLGVNLNAGVSVPVGITTTSAGFWVLFALFFPATTGLMAGIGLSGKLSDPKKQIPLGVISALIITAIIYLVITLWFANVSTAPDLITNTDVIVTQAAIPVLVLAGILAATFSSALTTIIAAPELLAAMGNNRVVPFSQTLSKKTYGEPRIAILFSAAFVAILLLTGSLDSIAPILTMFFLLAYATINFSVYLEKNLGNVSFRPTLKVSGWVSLYGAVGSLVFMFMINAFVAILALTFMVLAYTTLMHQNLKSTEGDARSGLFREIARWAAEKVNNLPEGNKHNWKPSILLPVVTTRTLLGNFPVIKSIAYPNGTMTVLGMQLTGKSSTPESQEISQKESKKEFEELPKLIEKFGKQHLFINNAIIEVNNYTNGICVALESIESQVFSPNLLYLSFKPSELPKYDLKKIFEAARKTNVGVIMLDRDEELGLGGETDLHVWIPEDAMKKDFYADRDFDLAMILAYRLYTNWDGKITLHMSTTKRKAKKAKNYLKKILYEARFPQQTHIHIHTEELLEAIKQAPEGDIHIMPVNAKKLDDMKKYSSQTNKSWLFVADGTQEDILA